MKKRPLRLYVIGVIIALAVVNYLAWFMDSTVVFHTSMLVSGGFLLGLIAMYIAMHIYRWDRDGNGKTKQQPKQ